MSEDTPRDNQDGKPLPRLNETTCPICGQKPMQQLDIGVSMSTLRVKVPEETKERAISTYVFYCERCYNIQSFLKTLPPK